MQPTVFIVVVNWNRLSDTLEVSRNYSLRALAAGFEVMLEPAASVFHKPPGSPGLESPVKEYYIVRNRYLLWRTHLSGWSRHLYFSRYLGWVLERALNSRAAGKEGLVGAALDAAWDGHRGRFGPWRPGASFVPCRCKPCAGHSAG